MYYNILEKKRYLLAHLETTYATLSADDLEFNHMCLADAWTPDEPIETLYVGIKHLRTIGDASGEPFSNSTVMRLTLSALLEEAGVYAHSIQTWCDHTATDHTWANFRSHFIHRD